MTFYDLCFFSLDLVFFLELLFFFFENFFFLLFLLFFFEVFACLQSGFTVTVWPHIDCPSGFNCWNKRNEQMDWICSSFEFGIMGHKEPVRCLPRNKSCDPKCVSCVLPGCFLPLRVNGRRPFSPPCTSHAFVHGHKSKQDVISPDFRNQDLGHRA